MKKRRIIVWVVLPLLCAMFLVSDLAALLFGYEFSLWRIRLLASVLLRADVEEMWGSGDLTLEFIGAQMVLPNGRRIAFLGITPLSFWWSTDGFTLLGIGEHDLYVAVDSGSQSTISYAASLGENESLEVATGCTMNGILDIVAQYDTIERVVGAWPLLPSVTTVTGDNQVVYHFARRPVERLGEPDVFYWRAGLEK